MTNQWQFDESGCRSMLGAGFCLVLALLLILRITALLLNCWEHWTFTFFLTEIHCVCWWLYLLSMGGCMAPFWVQFYFLFTSLGPHNQTLWYVIWLLCRWLHISCKLSELANLSSLHNCLVAVKDRMVENFLQLKSFKIEIVIIVPEHTFFKSCLLLALYLNILYPLLRTLEFISQPQSRVSC